jgi:hypothetical protein
MNQIRISAHDFRQVQFGSLFKIVQKLMELWVRIPLEIRSALVGTWYYFFCYIFSMFFN